MLDGIAWLGHDSFRLSGSKIIYIDPWHIAAGAPPADLILITHEHSDHFDKGDIATIRQPSTVIVAPAEVTRQVEGETRTVAPGDTVTVAGVTVHAVAAYNTNKFREPGAVFHPKEDAKVGYVIELDGTTYYHSGDTDIFSDMALINEIHAPQVAMVPIGDRFTMSPKTAALALKKFFKLKRAIPCHYGSFPIIEKTADKFVAEMKGAATKVIVPEKGKAVEV